MYIKRLLTLVSLVFICYLKGQLIEREGRINPIDHFKTEVYKSIIHSEEFKNNKKYHMVCIYPISLSMKHTSGFLDSFYDIKEIKDTTSIHTLKKDLSEYMFVYPVYDKFSTMSYTDLILSLNEKFTLNDEVFQEIYQKKNIDIIKIYEPLDGWLNLYTNIARMNIKNMEVIIPVKYERVNENLNKYVYQEKYYLFKIKIGYNDKGRLEIIQEIMK